MAERTFELTDAKGETRTVRENGAITLENRLNGLTVHFHPHGCETPVSPLLRRTRGFQRNISASGSTRPMTVAVGDGFRLPMDEYWFTQPSDEPDCGCMRLTHTEYGAWMEGDARLFDRTPDGTWHAPHGLPHWHESEVDVTGWKATRFPAVRTFGTTDLKWLAGKQVEESVELDHAVSNWLSNGSAANREHVLDELADLLQTVSNLCFAAKLDDLDIIGAMERCWEKNMRRERGDGGSDADGVPFHPNETVRVIGDGRIGRILPSDSWLDMHGGVRMLRVVFPKSNSLVQSFHPDELSHTSDSDGDR